MSTSPGEKAEEWQRREIEAGLKELDEGEAVSHEKVAKWLRTWGRTSETQAPK